MAATSTSNDDLQRGDAPSSMDRDSVYNTSQQVAALKLQQRTTEDTHDMN